MVDDLKIHISTKSAHKKINALKQELLSLTAKKRRVNIAVAAVGVPGIAPAIKKYQRNLQNQVRALGSMPTQYAGVLQKRKNIASMQNQADKLRTKLLSSETEGMRRQISNSASMMQLRDSVTAKEVRALKVKDRAIQREARHEKRGEDVLRKDRKNARKMDRLFNDYMKNRLKTGIKEAKKLSAQEKADGRKWNRENKQSMAPQWGKQKGGGGDGRILQMPQNPLLGRMAQFGMMASGMAATMFLFQMISAQIRMLMTIMTEWEDSILKIIDSTSLTSNNMDDLSTVIRDYARTMGIANTSMTEAMGAAFQFGIDPTQTNVQELYALQFSDNVKDYKEAAMIMNMAGTEFGDKAAASFTKKWDIYSGKGETSGSFGFEWEKLKGAGKGAMTGIMDTGYVDKLTNSMRSLSDWISSNQEAIGSVFDKFVSGLSAAWKMLKIITPAATIFLGLFIAKSGVQMFVWLLGSASKMLGPFSMGLTKAATEMAAMDAKALASVSSMTKMRTVLLGMTPAIVAVGVAFLGWELWKQIRDANKLVKAFKDIKKYAPADYAKMDEPELSSRAAGIAAQEAPVKKIIAKHEDLLKGFQKAQAMSLDKYGKSIFDKDVAKELKTIEFFKDKLKDFTSEIKEIELAKDTKLKEALKQLSGVSIVIPWTEQLAALEKINKELGYMPLLLTQMHAAMRKTVEAKGTEALGLGPRVLIDQKAQFKDLLQSSAEFKQKYEMQMAITSISTGGMNVADKKIFELEQNKKMMEASRDVLKDAFGSLGGNEELKGLNVGLIELDKNIERLKMESLTINTIAYAKALDATSEAIKQFDLSAFGKKMYAIDKQLSDKKITESRRDQLKLQEKTLLGMKLIQDLEKAQGKRPLDEQKRKDIAAALGLSKEERKTLNDILTIKGDIGSAERALTREKAKGLSYISEYETAKETEIKNLKAQLSFVLENLSETGLKYLKDRNKALKEYTDRLSVIARELTVGKEQTTIQGYISEIEMLATIEERKAKMAYAIDNDGTKRDAWHKTHIKNQLAEILTTEEQIKALESLISLTDRQAEASSRKITQEEITGKIALLKKQYGPGSVEAKGMSDEEKQRAIFIGREVIIQGSLKNELSAWETYYGAYGVMTDEHYQYELNAIKLNHYKNVGLIGEQNAEKLEIEEAYQLALRNRRGVTSEIDMIMAKEGAVRRLTEQYKTSGEIVEDVTVASFDRFADSVMDTITMTKSFKEAFTDMAMSTLTQITSMIIKQKLLNIVMSMSGGGGSIGGTTGVSYSPQLTGIGGYKQGGVLSGINAYSNSIVSSPTYVPSATSHAYATGGALFGEAGPEAIMPLTRTPDGDLGVKSVGGNVELHFHNAPPVKETKKSRGKNGGERLDVIFVNQMTGVAGGQNSFTSMLENKYGLNTALAGR